MIRDEFKNVDKKTIEKKANKKLMQMGERAYYTSRVSKYAEIFKPVRFSTIFSLISFAIIAFIYILPILVGSTDYIVPTLGWVMVGVTGALIIWTIVWFAFLAPSLKRKVEFWKEELSRINSEYVSKYRR